MSNFIKTYWIYSPNIKKGQPDYNFERFKNKKIIYLKKSYFFWKERLIYAKKNLPKIPNNFGDNFWEDIDHKWYKKMHKSWIGSFSVYKGQKSTSNSGVQNFRTLNLVKNHHFLIFQVKYLHFYFMELVQIFRIFRLSQNISKNINLGIFGAFFPELWVFSNVVHLPKLPQSTMS